MEQVDLSWALLGLKEKCFCRAGAEAGGAQHLSLCSSSVSGCAIAPCTAFLQPQALG